MCYSLREPDPERKGAAQGLPPSTGHRVSPRLVGAAIATIAGLAVAAVALWPSSTTAVVAAKPAQSSTGTVQQQGSTTLKLAPPAAVVVEQTATTMGDDVPTAGKEVARNTTGRHCDHEL